MWQRFVRQWALALGLLVLLGCLLTATRMCMGGSCLASAGGEAFRKEGRILQQWVAQDVGLTIPQLRESCERKVESSGRDHENIVKIEEQANTGSTLNELLEDDSEKSVEEREKKAEELAPLLQSLEVVKQATHNLTRYFQAGNYTGIRPKFRQPGSRRALLDSPSRGIVIAAGGLLPLTNAYATLHVLRHVHKSTLPVDIYYNGLEEFDHRAQQAFTDDFPGVTCRDLTKLEVPPYLQPKAKSDNLFRQQIGFTLKAKMLLLTDFEEVLVMDADTVPLADPEILFDLPEYKASGNVFWPDFWAKDRHCPGPVYKGLNLTDPWEVNPAELTVESGQFLVNRRRHFDVIQYMVMLNMYGEHTYKLMAGDKDTYRLAFSIAGKSDLFVQLKSPPANAMRGPADQMAPVHCNEVYPDIPHYPGIVAENVKPFPQLKAPSKEKLEEELRDQSSYKHAGMIQTSPQGKMLFLHHTADSKWDPRHSYAYFSNPVSYVSFPLNPEQAYKVFMDGWMFTDKFSIRNTENCLPKPGLELLDTIEKCHLEEPLEEGDKDKIALLPVHMFPELLHTIDEAFRVFQDWQVSFFKNTNPLSDMFEP